MLWSLITNTSPNPGDIFARLGVERLIRSVDPAAEFRLVLRDEGAMPERLEGVGVVCSMPGIWSHPNPDGTENSCITHHSFDAYNRYLDQGTRLIFAGIGAYCPLRQPMFNQAYVLHEFRWMISRCTAVWARSPDAAYHLGAHCSPCPAVWAPEHLTSPADLKLAALMPHGGHYNYVDHEKADWWGYSAPRVAEVLQERGFEIAAHSSDDAAFARYLGWPADKIHTYDGDINAFLSLYARCQVFVGNRVHGAITARAVHAPALCIGYDSRLGSVRMLGGQTLVPAQDTADKVRGWLDAGPHNPPLHLRTAREYQEGLLRLAMP